MSSEETPTPVPGFDTQNTSNTPLPPPLDSMPSIHSADESSSLPAPQPPRPDQLPPLPSQPAPPSQPTRYPSSSAPQRSFLRGFTPSPPSDGAQSSQATYPSPTLSSPAAFPEQNTPAAHETSDEYTYVPQAHLHTAQPPSDTPEYSTPAAAFLSQGHTESGNVVADANPHTPHSHYFVQPGLAPEAPVNSSYGSPQPFETPGDAISSEFNAYAADPAAYPEEATLASPHADVYFPAPDYFDTPTPSEKKSRGCLITFLSVFLTLAVIAATVFGIWYYKPQLLQRLFAQETDTEQSSTVPTIPAPLPESAGVPQWERVSAAVSPSVVTINVTDGSSGGVGSGVIYSPDGLIITNHHVIRDGQSETGEIAVTLHDQRVYDAEIVGTDKTSDLAVIRLKNPPTDLVVASIGTSKDLVVGQPVMAIGAPLGLSNTVTTGIISALDRPVEVSAKKNNSEDPFGQLDPKAAGDTVVTNAIQIDASINPGNSGGPLFNQQGQVIGINSSIASISENSDGEGGSIGLGFAIPSDLVRSVSDQLVQHGKVNHAVLGVSITSIARDVKGTHHLGVLVEDVTPGGAADKAGIREQDMITHIDDKRTPSAKSLQGVIRTYTAGSKVSVTVIRGSETLTLEATLQPRDE